MEEVVLPTKMRHWKAFEAFSQVRVTRRSAQSRIKAVTFKALSRLATRSALEWWVINSVVVFWGLDRTNVIVPGWTYPTGPECR
jgi:hypothetical protein